MKKQADLEKICDFLVKFHNSFDITCKIFFIEDQEKLKKELKKNYPDIDWKPYFENIYKASVLHVSDEIAGNVENYAKIKNFLLDDSKMFMLVLGKENSGKSLLLRHVFEETGINYEIVGVTKDFLANEEYNLDNVIKTVYVLDNIDSEKLHPTKRKLLNSLAKSKEVKNKIIVTAHSYDENFLPFFDTIVKIKELDFKIVLDFIKKKFPDIEYDVHELAAMYEEVQRDMYYFLNYITNGENTKERTIDLLKDSCELVYMIFCEKNRENLFRNLLSLIEFDYIRKTLQNKKIKYIDHLDNFIIENITEFFDPSDKGFEYNIMLLDYIKENRYKLNTYSVCSFLAYGIIQTKKSDVTVKIPTQVSEFKKSYKKFQGRKKSQESEDDD